MEENFKALGNKYVINLNAVAYFQILKDGGVKIVFQGVPLEDGIDIDSEHARHLVKFLNSKHQLAPSAGTVTLKRPGPTSSTSGPGDFPKS
jgi:hypothetical protein